MAGSKRAKVKQKANQIMDAISPSSSPPVPDDDDGLIDDLLAQIENSPSMTPEAAKVMNEVEVREASDSKKKRDPKTKFQDRQAKKAAALAASYSPGNPEADAVMAQEKAAEERAIKSVCDSLGLEMHEINPDGHCLYSAIADQLALLGLLNPQIANYKTTRAAAAAYMMDHPDDFIPFLPSVEGEDGRGATSGGLINPRQFSQYCATVRDTGTWGGEPEIMALSRAYNVPIHVAQWGSQPIVCHSPTGDQVDPKLPSVKISYHRRMYGLGEHYNSLRPKRGALQAMTGIFGIS